MNENVQGSVLINFTYTVVIRDEPSGLGEPSELNKGGMGTERVLASLT